MQTKTQSSSTVKISHLQLASLLAVSVIFSLTMPVPFTVGYSIERLVILGVSALIIILMYTPFIVFTAKNNRGVLEINNRFFKWFFGLIILIRLIYTAVLTALQMHIFIKETIMGYLSAIIFIVSIFAVALYGSAKGIQASARIAPLSLLLYIFVIVTVSALAWDRVEIIRIHSPFYGENIISRSLTDAIRNDELFFFATLCGFIRPKSSNETQKTQGQGFKSILYYLPVTLVTGVWLTLLYHAVFCRFAESIPYPLHATAAFSSLTLIERMDGVFVNAGIIGGILKIVLTFICIRVVISTLYSPKNAQSPQPVKPHRKAKITATVLLIGVAVLSYFVVSNTEQYLAWTDDGSGILNIFFAVTLIITALILPLTALIKSKKEWS
ncbi:MAG: hypothetical protein FWF94_02640 [Oscillospiraceae bacterium]|nr:hypothetical protein [Oscillospiraceae bacterium]